ncbi:hypothetical protein BpHYR1_054150 [Brachionus plicatilis]|uniref:Uncharacterized protein n=1 Tax=Brachionus plicatilis TaxID=10195 RepID=A0A3M7S8S3_BRAPC|nr:hypothetical protein BpHYR1_054150 [Brachionus plicatilis]
MAIFNNLHLKSVTMELKKTIYQNKANTNLRLDFLGIELLFKFTAFANTIVLRLPEIVFVNPVRDAEIFLFRGLII